MPSASTLRLRFDAFELDEADARLKRDGRPVPLAPKAFGVLCALARQPGVLVTKNALLDAVWGHQHVSESVLKTTISQVRAALADDASSPRFIETASRLGYRFIAALGDDLGPSHAAGTPAAAVDAVPIPASFIGRKAALGRLQQAWARAAAGQRQLCWIAGDAGVGKSTLIETFTGLSGAAAIVQGQCVEQYGSGEPYLPVLQALGDLSRAYPELGAELRAVAPTWLLQLPWLVGEAERAALARELVGVSQERMVREFHELMLRFTAKQPLLLVIEDLHWCDEATLGLLNHFVRQRGPARVMCLASFRLTQVIAEGHPLQALRQELKLHRLCDEIVLDPFSETEVQEYLRQRLPPDDAGESFVRRVHAHTEGLPLFVVNVVDALMAQEAEALTTGRHARAGTRGAALPVPEDLMGAVETRIGKLPPDAVGMLTAASVCGVEFRAGAVAGTLGRPIEEIIETCDRLVQKQYWLRHVATVDLNDGSLDASYAFRHAIYRHVFYHRMGDAPRTQLHRRVAQALMAGAAKGVPAAPSELASHHERGREPAMALRAYAQAAQVALRAFAPAQALEICEHALTLLTQVPEGPERQALELGVEGSRGVASAQLKGVGAPEARAIFERVRQLCGQLPQHPARALMLNGYGASLFSRGEFRQLQELATELEQLEGAEQGPLSVLTAFFRAGSFAAQGHCRVAADWWQKAIERCVAIIDRSGFQAWVVDPESGIRSNAVRTFYERGWFDQAREQARLAIEIANRTGQPLTQSLARWRAGMLEVRLGNPDQVLEHAAAIESIVTRTTVSQADGPSRYLRGWAMAQLGQPREGLVKIRDGLARHLQVGMIASSTEVMGYAADALILAEDWPAAEQELAEAFARARELDEQVYVPMLLILQSRLARGRGDDAAAYRWLQESVRVARAQEAPGFELKAAIALAEHPAATPADRHSLAELVATLGEGADIPDMQRARQLMRESPDKKQILA